MHFFVVIRNALKWWQEKKGNLKWRNVSPPPLYFIRVKKCVGSKSEQNRHTHTHTTHTHTHILSLCPSFSLSLSLSHTHLFRAGCVPPPFYDLLVCLFKTCTSGVFGTCYRESLVQGLLSKSHVYMSHKIRSKQIKIIYITVYSLDQTPKVQNSST